MTGTTKAASWADFVWHLEIVMIQIVQVAFNLWKVIFGHGTQTLNQKGGFVYRKSQKLYTHATRINYKECNTLLDAFEYAESNFSDELATFVSNHTEGDERNFVKIIRNFGYLKPSRMATNLSLKLTQTPCSKNYCIEMKGKVQPRLIE